MRIITNSNRENDRMYKLIKDQSIETDIKIAVAFFSESDLVDLMVKNNCNVSLIIRLGMGTSASALERIVENSRIDIRFFTGTYFHPKFYIFGNRIAYLGSSNLTRTGLTTNQEVNIEIDSEEPVFTQLNNTFYEYWKEAEVLNSDILKKYNDIMKEFSFVDPFKRIIKEIGEFEFDNVTRDKKKIKASDKFISNFRKNYQRYISKFNFIKDIYIKVDERRFPEIPLRIEVDRFLWWIREFKAEGESYKGVPLRSNTEIEKLVVPLIKEFIPFENEYLDNDAVPRYMQIHNSFNNSNSIQKMDVEELYATMLNIHAFHDRFRFFEGGHVKMKEVFLSENSEDDIKKSIIYLLYGKDSYESRIFNCIYGEEYKLQDFGESCVKELFGLINDSEIPISNGRTIKSMEWLGFGKL